MKYLFTYAYKGNNLGKPETGEGSIEITLHGSGKITPKVIKSACDLVRNDLNDKGIQIDTIAPMGWFKYDGDFNESDIKCAIQTVLLDKKSEVDTWNDMWDIMEGECIGFRESLLKLLDVLHIQYSEDEFKELI